MEEITTPRRAPFGSNPKVGEAGLATQQRILAAASEAFAASGYARTSVEAITDRANCSRPTFYQYFSGKEDLHRRLAGQLGAELSALLHDIDAITADAAGRDVLYRWLCGLSDVYQRHRAVADNFSASLLSDDQMVSGAAMLSAKYGDALLRAIDLDATGLHDVALVAGVANATAYGACIYRERIGDVEKEQFAAALADTLHRAFFGSIPGVNLGPRVPSRRRMKSRAPTAPTDPGDGPRRQRGIETRQRLLDAAATAYGMLGYDAVRVDDISAEAATSHGSFYRYFRNKESIFDEHADAVTREVAPILDRLPVEPGEEYEWARDYGAHYERHGGIIGCMRDACSAGSPGAIRARHQMTMALACALDRRSFGHCDADMLTCFSLLENMPAVIYGHSGLPGPQATGVTAVILGRGVFGNDGAAIELAWRRGME